MMFTFLVQPLDPNYPLRPELCQTKYKLIGHKCSLQFKKGILSTFSRKR